MGKAPEHHELSDYEVLMRVLEHAKVYVQKYGLHVLLGILVLTIGFLLYRTHLLRQQTRAYGTWEMLGRLDDPSFLNLQPLPQAEQAVVEDLAQVTAALESPGDAQATLWLLMKQASLLAAGSRWDEALAAYERVVRRYPEAVPLAEPAMAVVLEGAGRYADAAALCERLALDSAARWVDGGRCRELAGDLDEARSDYGRVLEADVDETLRGFATDRLAALDRGESLPPPPEVPQAPSQAPRLIVPADTPVQP